MKKSIKNQKVINSFNTNNKNSFNYNFDDYQKNFYLTQKLKKSKAEVIDPIIVEKKEKAKIKIPYIIKSMEKNNNSVYNRKMFDKGF